MRRDGLSRYLDNIQAKNEHLKSVMGNLRGDTDGITIDEQHDHKLVNKTPARPPWPTTPETKAYS